MSTKPNLDAFIDRFSEEFEEAEPGEITAETEFKQLAEWSSMHALIVTVAIDGEYGVTLTADELRAANTVQDLYDLVIRKQEA